MLDILFDFVQEDAVDYKLSVFRLFAELFPEFANTGLPCCLLHLA